METKMTSNTNNRGIMHLVRAYGGQTVCKSRRAIMATIPEKFAVDPHKCKRCEAIWLKWQARKEG